MAVSAERRLRDWVTGYQTAIPILTAHRLGIFDRLARAPKTPEQLRRALGADAPALRRLLDALVGLGLLRWQGERLAPAPRFRECLDPRRPDSLIGGFDHHAFLIEAWMRLEEIVLDGSASVLARRPAALDPVRERAFHRAMRTFGFEGARELMRTFDFRRVQSVLDVGGGTGVIAGEICKRHRHLRWTILDRPAALVIARRRLRAERLTGRVTCVTGDALLRPWPSGHDAVLFSQLIHSFGPREVQRLVDRAAQALPSGGLLLIRDFIPLRERAPGRQPGLFGLNMLVNTPHGQIYTLPHLRRLLAAAFRVEAFRDGGWAQLVVARRR